MIGRLEHLTKEQLRTELRTELSEKRELKTRLDELTEGIDHVNRECVKIRRALEAENADLKRRLAAIGQSAEDAEKKRIALAYAGSKTWHKCNTALHEARQRLHECAYEQTRVQRTEHNHERG
jgi:hypothetical protein